MKVYWSKALCKVVAFNILFPWQYGWSRHGTWTRLCRQWESVGHYNLYLQKIQHRQPSHCTPEDHQNHPGKMEISWYFDTKKCVHVLCVHKLYKNRQKTYIAGSFECLISTCTDDIGRKTGNPSSVRPLASTDVLVDNRHIHHSQVINTSTSFGLAPSSYMAHLVRL